MKNFVILSLLVVGGVAWWRGRKNNGGGGGPILGGLLTGPQDPVGGQAGLGVSVYGDTAAPNKAQQVLAALPTNADAVSVPGYAPAFGADENQPDDYFFGG